MVSTPAPLLLAAPSQSHWQRFVDGADPDMPDDVMHAWRRARALGVSPDAPTPEAVVDETSLRVRRGQLDRLVQDADGVLAEAARRLHHRDHVLLLCDLDGVVLRRWAGGAFAPEADAVRLIEGSVWAENVRGTNAIGTAVAERRAVICQGRAHFSRDHHSIICYAQMIRDLHGQPVAVLDATARVDRVDPGLARLVFGAARDLELVGQHKALADVPHLWAAVRLLEASDTPAWLVEENGRQVYANPAARGLHHAVQPAAPFSSSLWPERVTIGGQAFQCVCEPLDPFVLVRLEPVLSMVRAAPAPPRAISGMYAEDPAVVETVTKAARFAPTTLPVLLLAETGTGKELLARGVHAASPRRAGPFVALNCGAFPDGLVEAELFGTADGAFTGARRGGRAGRVQQANGGTLFLDEVAELPVRVQASLLRFLEDGTFFAVGGDAPVTVDVRLVCATCRDLPAMVADGRFREDLFYRIRGATLSLPPVRERRDVRGLVGALLEQLARTQRLPQVPPVSDAAWAQLLAHSWPGNVRELKHALHHALVLQDGVIEPRHLPDLSVPGAGPARRLPAASSLADVEGDAVRAALAAAGGNVSAAARSLGIARSSLYRKAKRYGIDLT